MQSRTAQRTIGNITHKHTQTSFPYMNPNPSHDNEAAPGISAHPQPSALFSVDEHGVFFQPEAGDPFRICAPLHVKALVRDAASENWGRLLEFRDADGHLHRWSMPMSLLKGGSDALRGELLRLGLEIAPSARAHRLLVEYLMRIQPSDRARCVQHTGWYRNAFVLPQDTLGTLDEIVLYQTHHPTPAYTQAGSLEDWQQHVACLCIGNSRLILAVSAAFAAPLIHLIGAESGGLHFVGASSSGKTTALRVAASVYGPRDTVCHWRATVNGLEAVASLHSDTLLILDELAQIDPKEAGEVAYLLANGRGKTRAGPAGKTRLSQDWRLLFLSAGEVSLAQHLRAGGKTIKQGQSVRLIDVPADAGAGTGLFENLHGCASGAAFSQRLQANACRYYGTAIRAFLATLTQPSDQPTAREQIKALTQAFLDEHLPQDAEGSIHRVCERFALIAAGGELASRYSVTGWPEQVAYRAAASCWQAWWTQQQNTETGAHAQILTQVRRFFEQKGERKFADWEADNPKMEHAAGFRRTENGQCLYYVLPSVFKQEVCAGLDVRLATQVLLDVGWLHPGPHEEPYRRERLPGWGRCRCYVVRLEP
ncbi:DUF927 domain-containing protein [Candidatus Glomeribacter gigasporarum]|nr:DUF927 domain-containing protein [Candidatus Glomeribacter gigasporarum]